MSVYIYLLFFILNFSKINFKNFCTTIRHSFYYVHTKYNLYVNLAYNYQKLCNNFMYILVNKHDFENTFKVNFIFLKNYRTKKLNQKNK